MHEDLRAMASLTMTLKLRSSGRLRLFFLVEVDRVERAPLLRSAPPPILSDLGHRRSHNIPFPSLKRIVKKPWGV